MQPKKVIAHYMVCNRSYGGSVAGYGKDIADAQAMGLDGFALNIGGWGSAAHYVEDTASIFAAAALNAAAQLTSANPLPPFMLFLSADMTGLDYTSIVSIMTLYSSHPNYAKMQVVNTAGVTESRPILSTWGGEGGLFDGPTTDSVKPRWHQLTLDVLKAANINVFFMPRFFVNWTPANVAALAVGFADGLFIQSSLGSIPPVGNQIDIVADLNVQLAAAKQAGLFTMGSVSPQYWGSKQVSYGRMYYEFNGSMGLHAQFAALINNSNCDWIECFTWNDFDETTYFSPIDDVNKYWPYCQNTTANFYKQRNGYKNEMPFYIQWFKTGIMPVITQNEVIGYHRTMPNSLHMADPIGVVYSGQWNPTTNAPNATDQVVFTTKLPAPATIIYTGGSPPQIQMANVLAGLQHTAFPFTVGPHNATLSRNNSVFLTLALDPIVGTITPPSYNFNYASKVATSLYVAPVIGTSGVIVRKNYNHNIPSTRIRQKYGYAAAVAPTAPPVVAGVTLTTGSVPQNLRCLTTGSALPGGGSAADGTFVWDPTPTTTALGTLVRYEMRAYLREATLDAYIPAGTNIWVCSNTDDDHQPEWTVQAIYKDAMGMETASRQSNICMRKNKVGLPVPSYFPTVLPLPMNWIVGSALWNEGAPLNHIEWNSTSESNAYRIDDAVTGLTLADGLFVSEYTDHSLTPGQTRTYSVYKSIPERTPVIYSPPANVTVTALLAQPSVSSMVPKNPVIYNYDGSSIIEVDAPFMYGDLRAYSSNINQVKFAGQNPTPNNAPVQNRPRIALQVDVPLGGADYTLNFVDKAGPHQPMNTSLLQDQASGMTHMSKSVNGQGPPCFVPTVASAPLVLHLTGIGDPGNFLIPQGDVSRAISLNFHNQIDFNPGLPIARSAMTAEWQAVHDYISGSPTADSQDFFLAESPKLWFAKYSMNPVDSNFFDMANHGMDMAVEACGPGSNGPSHIANGSNYMQMKDSFTLAPGEVLRFCVLADNHISGRDWIDLFIKELGDPFYVPGKFAEFNRRPTLKSNLYRAEFTNSRTSSVYYPPDSPFAGSTSNDRANSTSPNFKYNSLSTSLNQTGLADWFFDLGHEMEITVQYRASDGAVKVRTRARTRFTNDLTRQGGGANRGGHDSFDVHDFDPTMVWPWWTNPTARLVAAMEHLKYHSAIDGRGDGSDYAQWRRQDINRNLHKSERHWHGMLVDLIPVPAGQTAAAFPA